jgi:hypothetical protein
MAKFTFINEESSYMGNCKTTTEFSAVHIDDVLERFEDFLKGAGFVFDGRLEIIETPLVTESFVDVNKDLNDYRMSEQEEVDIRN